MIMTDHLVVYSAFSHHRLQKIIKKKSDFSIPPHLLRLTYSESHTNARKLRKPGVEGILLGQIFTQDFLNMSIQVPYLHKQFKSFRRQSK